MSASGANLVQGQWKKVPISGQEDGGGKKVVKRNADFTLNRIQ
jgi:hypothetical protein